MCKDRKTKFRLFGKLEENKEYDAGAKLLFLTLKQKYYDQFLEAKKTGKKIKLISDKLEHYRKGYNKFFRNVAILKFGVSIKQKKYGYKHNNNCIERDHQYSKDRTKIMRHFKELKSADEILDFFDICYNFTDEQKLKNEKKYRTPAQRAGIKINLPQRYRLLNLIYLCVGIED